MKLVSITFETKCSEDLCIFARDLNARKTDRVSQSPFNVECLTTKGTNEDSQKPECRWQRNRKSSEEPKTKMNKMNDPNGTKRLIRL